MRRTTIILGLTLAVGITLGAFGERFLIHAAANFASFLRLRELSINESTFCRMVWK
jgi:hypothetical protein